jgi:transaldolase/glucose-6-phosphate isomerase
MPKKSPAASAEKPAPAAKTPAAKPAPAAKAKPAAKAAPAAGPAQALSRSLPHEFEAALEAALADWTAAGKTARLWARDASLWTNEDEAQWMGWLDSPRAMREQLPALEAFAAEVADAGFGHIALLGMGGSSLCPEVWKMTFGVRPGHPELHVLDSTDPAQVRAVEAALDMRRTLVVVSSKSGSTLEPNIFRARFFERMKEAVGPAAAGSRFVAITDPGSQMQKTAEADGFLRIFAGDPTIGGRYSALSPFGLVPAAAMGLDVGRLLDEAARMAEACGPKSAPAENPGVLLGAILGSGARAGYDKVTLITSPAIYDLGAWLEQLLAESTGKSGKGLIPVDLEIPSTPDTYGEDRLFVYTRLAPAADAAQDAAVAALESAGLPVVRIEISDPHQLAAEFFRWEIATAVAGSILGIHPFNQPDVEASKIETRKLTSRYEKTGALAPETPVLEDEGIALYTDAANASHLSRTAGDSSLEGYLRAHLARIGRGDYFALLAYIPMTAPYQAVLQQIRHQVRDVTRAATCLGFGPRFLHSTGQAYKGGPNTGVFLQITCEDAEDLEVPGQKYTFGVVKSAQARGDFAVLAERGRRALRVHLGSNVSSGLKTLRAAIGEALRG